MYMIGVFCLVATAVALPVLPDPPSLPESSVTVQERRLRTNVPEVVEIVEVKQDDKKDDSKDEKESKVIPLPALPSPPELPPLEESIYKNLKMNDEEQPIKLSIIHKEEGEKEKTEIENEKSEIEDEKPEAEAEISEQPKEEPKEEEPKKEDVVVKIEEVKEKPLADLQSPAIIQWKIPRPSFLTNMISSLPSLSFWPFNRPSIIGNPRTNFPGYVLVQE